MGRTQEANALIRDLKRKIKISKIRKKRVVDYFNKLQESYSKRQISEDQYISTLNKDLGEGRTLQEWIQHYDFYIRHCERRINKHIHKKRKTKFLAIVLSFAFIAIILSASFILDLSFTGLIIQGQEQEFFQILNIEFNQSQTYELELKEIGQLLSAKLSGIIEGEGTVKVYLDDFLILDNSKENSNIQERKISITGLAIVTEEEITSEEETVPEEVKVEEIITEEETVPEEESIEETVPEIVPEEINQSDSEEIKEEEVFPTEDLSPSQEEPLQPSEIEITIKEFSNICEETCDLSNLNLNKTSYNLRIEISNAKLKLERINYKILREIPEEIEFIEEAVIENITTIQYQAVLGQPVKWKKTVQLEEQGPTKIKLPKEAENIQVNKVDVQDKEIVSGNKITGQVISGREGGFLTKFFQKLRITGRAIDEGIIEEIELEINETGTEYEIEYETPAPYAIEEDLENGKRVKIVGPETVHYENVLAFTTLNENLNIKNPSTVRIHWIENNTFIPIQKILDSDNNGIYDYIEWIAPELSNQTFEIIIITKAEHLNSNRNFISNIYEELKELDNVWSETIPDENYVRVTFETPLDNTRDITIYPRVVSGTPRIEVYEIDGTELIAEFTSLTSDEYNKIFLTNLISESQDVFDLKILNGDVEFDHIIDPDLFYDDWDDGLEDGWTENPTNRWGVKAGGPSGSTNYWESSGGTNEQAYVTGGISTVGYTNIKFEFQGWVSKLDGGTENLTAKWFDGTTWTTELDITGTIDWTPYSYSLPASAEDNANFQIMFICGSGGGEKCGIDEVNISGFSEPNTPPTISELPDVQDDEDFGTNNSVMDLWIYSSDAEDADADLIYAIQSESDTSAVDCGIFDSHYITCTSQTNVSGFNDVNVSVTDTGSAKSYDLFRFTVNEVNDPPWSDAIANPGNINEDSGFNDNIVSVATINIAFRDLEEDQSLTSCTIATETDTTAVDCTVDGSYNVDCTTQANQSGSNTVTLNCCDSGSSCIDMDTFTVTVDPVNDNPWDDGLSNPGNVNEDLGLADNVITKATLDTTFRDIEEDQSPTSYAIQGQTGSSVINCVLDGGNNIDCTTQANQSGSNTVTVRISDSEALYTEPTFTITVDGVNDQPWVSELSDPANLSYNSGLNQDVISSTNVDNNFRDVEEDQSPTIVAILSETHTEIVDCTLNGHALDCTTQTDQYGISTVTINYTDSGGLYITDSIDISITEAVEEIAPTYNLVSTNNTFVEQATKFAINVTDDTALHPNGQYIFSTNNTGNWVNDSAINFTTTPSWANVTKILNSTAGTIVGYMWYFNDTVGNLNATSIYTLTTTLDIIAPTIDWVESLSAQNPTDDSTTSVTFNFTVTDTNGYEDINVSSVNASFLRAGEAVRINNSCINYSQSGNDMNFTCTIDMWYFDENGAWTINVTIKDNAGEYAENSSESFIYNLLPGMKMSPINLGWPEINLPDTNTGSSSNPIQINNTGNSAPLNINITGYDLQGEDQKSYYIYAVNFTVDVTADGCSGISMLNETSLNITSAILFRGNHSLNYNNATSGQEQLYFCLKGVPQNNPSQSYSSSAFGAWEIRILLVAVIPRKRRKKKKEKTIEKDNLLKALNLIVDDLKEEYSLNKKEVIEIIIEKLKAKYHISRAEFLEIIKARESISIPITIFTKELGALESLTKYMKENLNMSYREISKEIGRDERTIWTSYKKAKEKQKEPIKVKETKIKLPISIFENKELTILESLIVYLKEKEMKYSEIAEFLERNQRNIWTIYSRAIKKIKNK